MRITDTYNLGHLKCTLFVHDAQYTLQIEDEYGAISYKLKDLSADKTLEIKDLLSLHKVKDEIISGFRAMRKGRDTLLDLLKDEAILDDEII